MFQHILDFGLDLLECSSCVSCPPQGVPSLLGSHPEEEVTENEVNLGSCGNVPVEESKFLFVLDKLHQHVEYGIEAVHPDIALDLQHPTLQSIFAPPSCCTMCRVGVNFFKLGFVFVFKPLSCQLKSLEIFFSIVGVEKIVEELMVLAGRNLVFYRIEDLILKPGELLDDVDCFRRVFVLIFNSSLCPGDRDP